jgi:hypothetical protein
MAALCPAQGRDVDELRLVCIREPHDDRWHQDGPLRWWMNVPDDNEKEER